MSFAPVWGEERSAQLVAFAKAGLSIAASARKLRTTRGAIAGRASRMGLSFKGGAISPPMPKPKPAPRARRPRMAPEDRPIRRTFDLDRATNVEVIAFANRQGVSLSAAIRLLVEWGLEAEVCS
jgi:hypothetical protein